MPETVLVTICYGNYQGDFELPAQIPLKNWEKALAAAVKSQFRIFSLVERFLLMKDKVQLQPQWTLAQCGIFDGSILQLVAQ